jgi:hypothetical protein
MQNWATWVPVETQVQVVASPEQLPFGRDEREEKREEHRDFWISVLPLSSPSTSSSSLSVLEL